MNEVLIQNICKMTREYNVCQINNKNKDKTRWLSYFLESLGAYPSGKTLIDNISKLRPTSLSRNF